MCIVVKLTFHLMAMKVFYSFPAKYFRNINNKIVIGSSVCVIYRLSIAFRDYLKVFF